MTLPKRWNRYIVVGGETYRWYLRGQDWWNRDGRLIGIAREQPPHGQLLLFDFDYYEFEMRPQTIRDAIEFSLTHGWQPKEKGAPFYIGNDNVRFVVLAPGQTRNSAFQLPPSLQWLYYSVEQFPPMPPPPPQWLQQLREQA